MTPPSKRLARISGLLLGLGLSVAFVVSMGVAASGAEPPAHLSLTFGATDEVLASPARPLSGAELTPGRSARARASVANPTDVRLAVRIRAVAESGDLDALVRLAVRVGDESVRSGTLGELRAWNSKQFVVGPRAQRGLVVRAWLPASAREGYQARLARVKIELRAEPTGTALR